MDVLIVGAGTMGRWFGETVDADVAFADVDEATAREAADAVGGRAVSLSDGRIESRDERREPFDAVCIAVPMGHVEDAIEAHASLTTGALLDVSGVMEPVLEAMATHGSDCERVSLHPLFAPDRAPGSIAVVRDESGPVSEAILEDLETAGNVLVETTAVEHDQTMESVQASAHAAVLAFALAAERVPEGFETPIYGGLRALVERITGGTTRVYADIQNTFDGAADVAAAAERIAAADPEDVEALYREAADRWAVDDETRGDRTERSNGRSRRNAPPDSGGDRDGRST